MGLCLTRHRDEVVVINGDIFVRVIEVKGDRVKLDFTAPSDVTVNRLEVEEQIRQRNAEAAISTTGAPKRRPSPVRAMDSASPATAVGLHSLRSPSVDRAPLTTTAGGGRGLRPTIKLA
jgi:carbon storage regulator